MKCGKEKGTKNVEHLKIGKNYTTQRNHFTNSQALVARIYHKKNTGVDNISSLLLKQASSIIAQPLTKLINKSMQQSIFPHDLKTAKVCPIHKKNSLDMFFF